MKYKNLILVFLMGVLVNSINGQELDVHVTVTAPNLKNSNNKIAKQFESSVREFFNNTKWTEDEYEKEEKIQANLSVVIIEEPSTNNFIANFTLQSKRPVFKSDYSTILVNISDQKVAFEYIANQTIENASGSFYDHLSSTLTMYAYTILAYDYDSFSQFGGDVYFDKAQDIMNALPRNYKDTKLWDIEGKNNKGVMVKNMLDARFRPYRQAFYEYHRLGLDKMYEDAERSKAVIVSCLNTINDVNKVEHNSTALQMFADSKRNELVEIFKQSGKGMQKKVYNIMTKIDPSQASTYGIFR